MILMFIYGSIQVTKQLKLSTLLLLTLPFIVYLWSIYIYQPPAYIAIVSALFYFLVTHKKYVAFCKDHKEECPLLEEDLELMKSTPQN